ncbi:MAG: ATP-dependent metallopeptidase FtsH/Yme1/Tma family protein, partial [Nisaea sp.]|uniref:ATP-dependent metallopeptidase FtsH/Yme1/Tma family protein n=1 Tax=Nisaea sp. TaxID=2024842 RepID=UPI003267D818
MAHRLGRGLSATYLGIKYKPAHVAALGGKGIEMNANFRNFALWVIIALLLIALFQLFQSPGQRSATNEVAFSQFLNQTERGEVRDVTIQEQQISGHYNSGGSFQT